MKVYKTLWWRRTWRLKIVVLFSILSLALAACANAGSGPNASQTKSGELTPVRVAFNPGTALRLYAGLANGLFEKHGLNVELVQFESGAATNAAFASGGVDLGFAGIPGILTTRLAAKNNRVFMVDNDGWKAEGLVVGPKSGIRSVRDLKGKTIGTVVGTTSWMGLISALKAEGINPSEVNIKNVGPAAWAPAFNKGDVDGIWGWAPLIFTIEESGGTIVATDSDYVLDPLLWQVRGDFLQSNRKAVESFVAAYDEASDLVDKRDSAFLAKMREMTGVKESIAQTTIAAVKPVSVEESVSDESPYSLSSPNGMAAIMKDWLDVLLEQKILRSAPDMKELIDPAPIQSYLANKNSNK